MKPTVVGMAISAQWDEHTMLWAIACTMHPPKYVDMGAALSAEVTDRIKNVLLLEKFRETFT